MIVEIKGTCEYEDCNEPATQIACGRISYLSHTGHNLGCYCEYHSEIVADEDDPEYVVYCPNCGCAFGVN